MLERHPYIEHFDPNRCWKYLVIGTFPPNPEVRESINSFVDYFYGNRGSFWKIIEKIYPDFDFTSAAREARVKLIKDWQEAYGVGVTDTIIECERYDPHSSNDSDLIIDWNGYNHGLRLYVIANISQIEKIIFTSSRGCNSAYQTFKIIMGEQLSVVPKDKLVVDLPSPSGSSNTAIFNVNNENTHGLHPAFLAFINERKSEHLSLLKNRWLQKKKNKETGEKNQLPTTPPGLVKEFKLWSYSRVLPERSESSRK